ncbi:Flp pilus assembly protein, secretin CpaC [Candidatus Terasakiella magnetica]|nr:Flp pilus assembly protein, secretin CpaC [Candidatus Terasakiella magnetica]
MTPCLIPPGCRRIGGVFLLLGILLLLTPVAWAEEPPVPQAQPRAKVVALGQAADGAPKRSVPRIFSGPLPAVAESIRVAVHKSAEIHLPVQARDIVVGNPDIADVMVRSPTQVYVTGRAIGQTNVFLLDKGGKVIRRLEVDVAIDSQSLKDVLAQTLPEERNIQVAGINDTLYLSGTVKNDLAANTAKAMARRFVANDANVVTLLRISNDQQVLLQVKVAEIQRTVLKELGVGVASSRSIPLLGSSTLTSAKTTSTVGLLSSAAAPLYGAATITGIGTLVTNLNLLENQGLIRTLVEPNLTAVSGETATMVAGGEVPIAVSQTNGAVSIEYKPYGVLLSFTPVVLDPGRLSLKMSTEVSAIDTSISTTLGNGITVPSFKVRRAGSTVELPSGGSLMIAGLLQNDITNNIAGLPGLMDLPVLGALFRSSAFQRNESELVVILSAYVVQPVDKPDLLAAPTDGFAPSSDIKRFLLGRLQDTYTIRGAEPLAAPAKLQGPYGYMVP